MENWIMYGRCTRSAFGAGQWVRIAEGATQQEWMRAQHWWSRSPIWDEIKTENQ